MANDNNPFECVNAVSHSKDMSMLDDPTFEKKYVPFIVNRALSYHADAVLAANIMNERPFLSKYLQFRFLAQVLRPRKRYSKWLKQNVSENAEVIAEYYGVSMRHANTLTSLHTDEQIAHMRGRLYKGGRS